MEALVESWRLSMRAENKSPATITAYSYASTQFARFLAERGTPQAVE